MKRILTIIVVVTVITYLLTSFLKYDLNPKSWGEDVRMGGLYVWLILMYFGFSVAEILNIGVKKQDEQ